MVKLDEEFKPNLLNTTIYIMSVALQVSTFAVNYRVKSNETTMGFIEFKSCNFREGLLWKVC